MPRKPACPDPPARSPAAPPEGGCGATWGVYLVRCADGTLYAGSTTDVDARVRAHNAGRGAKYTAGRRPVAVVYQEVCGSRSAALKRECALKRLSRSEKEALIAGTPGLKTRGSIIDKSTRGSIDPRRAATRVAGVLSICPQGGQAKVTRGQMETPRTGPASG